VSITHIQSLADGDAVDQLFYKYFGSTAIMHACCYLAPLELYQLMITTAKLDSRKRCLMAIANSIRYTALHYASECHSDPAVLELLIREHPLALSATDGFGRTPLQWATFNNRPAAITSLLTDATNALAARDYAALAAGVHSDERTVRCNAPPPATRALRTTLLLCIKHGYVYISRNKRHRTETVALDTPLAFVKLNYNVWSHVMTFL